MLVGKKVRLDECMEQQVNLSEHLVAKSHLC